MLTCLSMVYYTPKSSLNNSLRIPKFRPFTRTVWFFLPFLIGSFWAHDRNGRNIWQKWQVVTTKKKFNQRSQFRYINRNTWKSDWKKCKILNLIERSVRYLLKMIIQIQMSINTSNFNNSHINVRTSLTFIWFGLLPTNPC